MSFSEFVAIELISAPDHTIDHKAMLSFANSIRGCVNLSLSDQLRLWIADMIDKGLASASRKRYIEKLSTIYKKYSIREKLQDNPFEEIRELRDNSLIYQSAVDNNFMQLTERFDKVFSSLMSDAKAKPELALFLYLLFDASPDIEKAVFLSTDDYSPRFRQLDDIIRPACFHHRRKYVFDLNQSRKRLPQLVRDTLSEINLYLKTRNIHFSDGFTCRSIMALWAAKARSVGVGLREIKGILPLIPDQYGYLEFVEAAPLPPEQIEDIKHRVAEAFAPSSKRWYALKLRRGVVYDTFRTYLKDNFSDYTDSTLFYPQREVSRSRKKKLVIVSVPVIPDIVFFNVMPYHVRKIDHLIRSEYLGWVFKMTNTPDSDYSVISHHSMLGFQQVIGEFTDDMKITLTKGAPVGIGRQVKITGGIMAGYTGWIYDIKEGSDLRQFYIRLSTDCAVRAEIKVPEFYVRPI